MKYGLNSAARSSTQFNYISPLDLALKLLMVMFTEII